jgi:hypothetical protein
MDVNLLWPSTFDCFPSPSPKEERRPLLTALVVPTPRESIEKLERGKARS